MNIALIGYRGTGKTTIAKILSRKLDKKLISTDEEIAKKTKLSIGKFVKKYGWDKFREVESEVIEYICDFDDCIIDTGGGIVMRNENITNLKRNGWIVLLSSDVKTITERLKKSRQRPSLTKKNYIDEVEDVLNDREKRYKQAADYSIDTSRLTPEEACDLIIHYFQTEMQ